MLYVPPPLDEQNTIISYKPGLDSIFCRYKMWTKKYIILNIDRDEFVSSSFVHHVKC